MKKQIIKRVMGPVLCICLVTGCAFTDRLPFLNTEERAVETINEQVQADGQNAAEDVPAGDENQDASKEAEELLTRVRILNDSPDLQESFEKLADAYESESGVETEVALATDDVYRSVLEAGNQKEKPATVFLLHSKDEIADYDAFCENLSDAPFAGKVLSDSFVCKNNRGEVSGVMLSTDFYGLIYNRDILSAYMGLPDALIYSVSEIDSFEMLSKVAADIQKHKAELKRRTNLPVKGAFTSSYIDTSSGWKFSRLLLNDAVYYEEKDGMGVFSKKLKGKYLPQYKEVLDLMLSNATCDEKELQEKSGGSAVKEFAAGEAAFYFGGTWSLNNILGSGKITASQMGMMPLYFANEACQEGPGLLNATYVCINREAKERDKEAALEFLDWCVTDADAQKILMDEMGYTLPYETVSFEEYGNVLVKDAMQIAQSGAVMKEDRYALSPSREWEKAFEGAVKAYVLKEGKWDEVEAVFADQ